MGMFDYLRCDHPLPSGEVIAGAVWQTKDGPCELGLCVITAEGRFLVPVFTRSEGEAPLVDSQYHGDVYFYRCGKDPSSWEEYRARFTEGQLVRIERVEREWT